MATEQLAEWIHNLNYSDLPDSVIEAATRSFHNSLGCIIGAAGHETVLKLNRMYRYEDRPAQCTIFGRSRFDGFHRETTISNAISINGVASHVNDYDDTHLQTIIHPAGAIVVALLAQTESSPDWACNGEEFITAVVVGIETSLRLGNAISPNHYSAGWHITGTVSPIGVAAAVSKLMHLTLEQIVYALGIASTQPVGLRVHFGTDTKALHVSRAAQSGLQAVELAQGGFTAAVDALEGRRGWVEVLGHGANNLNEQINQLMRLTEEARNGNRQSTEKWETEKNTFKPFPCGIVIHPIIDACIQLHNEQKLKEKLATISSIHLQVHPLVLDLTGKRTPQDDLEAKFSVYHGAAIGLLFGSATPAQYKTKVVQSLQVIQIRDRVTAEANEKIRSDEAFVTIRLTTGEEITKHVEHAVGSQDRPMTDEELRDKFRKQVEPVLEAEQAALLERLAWEVNKCGDMSLIIDAAQ
ncbi:hypothetical protein LTR64_005332 [Lithohypha guttulata]|uniref:uncharacterized protein n=1 Tax=Lithohypha guttulata TaxID=1690604 RepID=UPI002DDFE411|nr:hypothetical protein LTR51_002873 [Lithohypha guttulata]